MADDERDPIIDTEPIGPAADEAAGDAEDLSAVDGCAKLAGLRKGANTAPGPDENVIRKVHKRATARDAARDVRMQRDQR